MGTNAYELALARGRHAQHQGDMRAALQHFKDAEKADPADSQASLALFALARQTGDTALAVAAGRRALRKAPENLDLLAGFGHALAEAGDADASFAIFAKAAEIAPTDFGAQLNYANALVDAKRPQEAVALAVRIRELDPASAAPYLTQAGAELALGHADAAVRTLEQAKKLEPESLDIDISRVTALRRAGHWQEAADIARRLIARMPEFASMVVTLGNLLFDLGDMAGAIDAYRRAVALGVADAQANLVSALNFEPPEDPATTTQAHRALVAGWAKETASAPARKPAARLRVGFVSPNFNAHSVSYFVNGWIGHVDGARIETFAYSDARVTDASTARLKPKFGHWRNSSRLGDRDFAKQVASDRIDILVDLAGHTEFHRLRAFARRLAPLQATWIGYPATTGLAAMDWRLGDATADPAGLAEDHFVERIYRLPHFLCYEPPADAGDTARIGDGALTFGSFNNAAKLSAATLALWAEILSRVPGAQLLLKAKTCANADTANRLRGIFAARGIAAERIVCEGHVADRGSHLARYGAVDIALDPLGYNGTTTTCEALWMGVPVVVAVGDRHASRVGASLMAAADLPELVAPDKDGYVDLAVALANDAGRRAAYRRDLRAKLRASALLDGARMAAEFADAMHAIWHAAEKPRV